MAVEREKIVQKSVEAEMKTSYIDYAMSVIVGRALPDVRDGLKPVHRRIIYSMYESGVTSTKPYKKSARIVGDVLGKYHPHGDTAVYDALIRMAQDFSLRYPLIDGQGNFGSVDGDSPAAMRYTESRLAKIAEEMVEDIEKETVKFADNYDGSLKEPTVLPAKLPNLLINGSSGIAVGMATNIPPHNLSEVVDGITLLINNPDAELRDLMSVIRAPDFPTGGIIYGISGIVEAYSTGRGLIRIRARTSVEESEGRRRIIVTEIPYMVNKANLIESIAELVREKRIEGISDLRDESDREGMRIVIELKRDAQDEVVLNQLFAHTAMESSFGVINLALVDNKPSVLTLKETLMHYIDHRRAVIRRRTEFDLKKAEMRAHILEGLIVALDNIDAVIKLIKSSKDAGIAKGSLIKKFDLSEEQAKAILEMRLQRLTALEMEGILKEHDELLKKIARLKEILASEQEILRIIKEELAYLKEKYGDERRTEIVTETTDLDIKDLIPDEDVVITITKAGYIKRIPVTTYRQQRRGGVGLVGMGKKEEDVVTYLFIASTHALILFFTNKGKVYWLETYRIPEGGRYSRGKAIVNLLPELEEGEKVSVVIHVKEFLDKHYLIFATKNGIVKKTPLKMYSRPRVTGIRAINLDDGDELVSVKLSDGSKDVILATKHGQAIRFLESEIRAMGRAVRGVRGIRLRGGDDVVSMALVKEDDALLTITENGYGKRTPVKDYRSIRRGGMGVRTIKTNERNGFVVSVKEVKDGDELILTTLDGMVIRVPASDISIQGRNTMGVRVMRLRENDRIVDVATLKKGDIGEVE